MLRTDLRVASDRWKSTEVRESGEPELRTSRQKTRTAELPLTRPRQEIRRCIADRHPCQCSMPGTCTEQRKRPRGEMCCASNLDAGCDPRGHTERVAGHGRCAVVFEWEGCNVAAGRGRRHHARTPGSGNTAELPDASKGHVESIANEPVNMVRTRWKSSIRGTYRSLCQRISTVVFSLCSSFPSCPSCPRNSAARRCTRCDRAC